MKDPFLYSFIFPSNFVSLNKIDFNNPVLWILNNHHVPPHIGFSFQNKYLSLKAYGKDVDKPVVDLINKCNYKKIPIILVELKLEISSEKVYQFYNKYNFAGDKSSTCITPILEILSFSNTSLILPELLQILFNQKKISSVSCINQADSKIGIRKYNRNEVLKINDSIKNVKGR